MRCLQCGKELALLKKLTESEFCSPEHRTAFNEKLHRLTVERLADSAFRLGLKTRLAPSAAVKQAVAAKKKKNEKLPPFAAFIAGHPPHPYKHAVTYLAQVDFDNSDLLIIPPTFSMRRKAKLSARLADHIVEFLHARASQRRFRDIKVEFVPTTAKAVHLDNIMARLVSKVGVAKQIRTYSHPVPSDGAPSSRTSLPQAFDFTGSPAQPDLSTVSSVSALSAYTRMKGLEGPDSRLGDVSLHGGLLPEAQQGSTFVPELPAGSEPGTLAAHRMPFRARPRAPIPDLDLPAFQAIDTDVAVTSGRPAVVSLAIQAQTLAPAPMERAFRVRPRGGVADASLPSMDHVEPQFGAWGSGADMVDAGLTAAHLPGPPIAARPASNGLPGAVDSAGSTPHGQLESLEVRNAAYVPAALVPVAEYTPRFLDRAFKMRPRAGVESLETQRFESILASSTDFPSSPAGLRRMPDGELPDFTPVHMDRAFRMRPRGPVDAPCTGIIAGYFTAAKPEHTAGAPSIVGLKPREQDLETAMVSRPFRMRPRGPVECASLPAHVAIDVNSPEPLETKAAAPNLAVAAAACTPSLVERPFRMRPRGPVASSDLADLDKFSATNTEPLLSAAAIGTLPPDILGDQAPNLVDWPFRMRPRGPVNAESQRSFEAIPAGGGMDLSSAAQLASLPADVLEHCAPNLVDKPFRMRPRGPVSANVSDFDRVTAGDIASLASRPAVASLPERIMAECAPSALANPFRMRPRGPVSASLSEFDHVAAGDIESLASRPAVASLPQSIVTECAPSALSQPFRMRPRGPVSAAVSEFNRVTAGDTASLASRPVLTNLPESGLADCEPAAHLSPFRMRPRGPVAEKTAASFQRIMTGDTSPLERRAVRPDIPSGVVAACNPNALDRPVRLRPRGPVQDSSVKTLESIPVDLAAASKRVPTIPALTPPASAESALTARSRPMVLRPRGPVRSSSLTVYQTLDSRHIPATGGSAAFLPVNDPVFGDMLPSFVDKLYRMRPRGPVHAEVTATLGEIDPGAIELVLPLPLMPEMPAVLMRQATMVFREKPIKMRPRGPQASSTTPNAEKIEPSSEGGVVSAASMQGLGPNEIGECVPLVRLDVAPTEAWMPLPVPGRLPAIPLPEPEPAGLEIFAQTLSDALCPGSRLHPAASDTMKPVPAMAPLASAVSIMGVLALLSAEGHVTRPVNTLDPEFDRIAEAVQAEVAARREQRWKFLEEIAAFWGGMRLDQKLAGAVGVLLMAVVLHALLFGAPKSMMRPGSSTLQTADVAENPIPPLKDAVTNKWETLQPVLKDRAALELQEDFSSGFRNWQAGTLGMKGWVADTYGARTGDLALYKPSITLTDYQLQFTGDIRRNALGFVYRATDRKNYYAVKLQTIKSGRMPTIYVVRYAVIGGKEGPRKQIPLSMTVTPEMVYNVALNASGQYFTLLVQGKVVDFWSDDRLKSGGVGFFSGKGEQAHLQEVRIAHQDDTLGKLCAFLSSQEP